MRAQSADRLRGMLAHNTGALGMYQNETLYHVQVDWTCKLLDVVDEVTDPVTAALITDVIYERLTGDGVSEAAQRIRAAAAQMERLMYEPGPPVIPLPDQDGARWMGIQ
jgi:hypothetical protein